MTVGELLKFIKKHNIPEEAFVTMSDAEGNDPEIVAEPQFMDKDEAEGFGNHGFDGPILHMWGN